MKNSIWCYRQRGVEFWIWVIFLFGGSEEDDESGRGEQSAGGSGEASVWNCSNATVSSDLVHLVVC